MPRRRQQVDNPDRRVARVAAEEWGALTSHELAACGLGPNAIGRRLRAGHLHRLYRGVYAVGHTNLTIEGRYLAAVKACGPGAVLSHLCAAILLGLTDAFDRLIDVTVTGTSTRTHAGIRVHRTAVLDARDITRHRGVPVTTPLKTLHDCALDTTREGLTRLVRRAQALHHVNLRQLASSPRLAPLVATGPTPTRTEFEDVLLDLVLTTFEAPDVNPKLIVAGRTIRPDLRWPAQRLCVEADSRTWHGGELARAQDAERQAILEAHGERVVRLTWPQTTARPQQTIARLRAAGAPTLNRP
jgi:hypothetical protein